MNKAIIAPSILAADLSNFHKELEILDHSAADWIHIDVMDGSFVPPITFGDNIIKICAQHSAKFLDVHLMITAPEKHFKTMIKAGSHGITFHIEATPQPKKLLQQLKAAKIQAGLAIKPNTPWEDFKDLIPECDLLLIMTVEPGYGGQSFLPAMLEKVRLASEYIRKHKLITKIEVDGGINESTGKQCWEAGAEILVAGSYIFNSPDPVKQIAKLSF